ncbi:MAG: NifU family protein [Planctomycetota bacterium]|nr:MAG: NifU family protein [Planctomycetota bacterium]
MVNELDEHPFGTVASARLADLRRVGSLNQVDANARDLRLLATSHGASHGKDHIDMTALANGEGVIQDLKYRTLGTGWDLLCWDILADLCIGQGPDRFEHLSGEDVVAWLVERGEDRAAIPDSIASRSFPVLVKLAVLARGGQAESGPAVEPAPQRKAAQLDWEEVGLFEKVRRVEEVLDEQVRPMLASDGGNIELVDLRDKDLLVHYTGACGSCSSSVGGTMVFIEDTLNNALGVELRLVVQNMEEPEPFLDL